MKKRGKHTSIESSLKRQIEWLESQEAVEKVVIGVSEGCRHKFPPGHLKVQSVVGGGVRLNGYSGIGVTRIFIKIADQFREDFLEKLRARVGN